ncbi:metallophosphoesterase [Flavobacterium sp. SM15]|uniref:metallophosphoesterase n=1 Tax=Flavobacterium sp. SM15 TaxID=2908005 RepID=UPI001EDBA88A|nr:metallophosphoesterase [Flavobacterium sp. SM15]MCG2610944.1 metallophosphoesterase [Flavobacterium sp. SM15]
MGLLILQACATYHPQYGKQTVVSTEQLPSDSLKTIHTFYLIGDAGNADDAQTQQTLSQLEKRLLTSDKNATLLFLGDNIYPLGMPSDKNDLEYAAAATKLSNQLKITENFKGKTFVIPGNHDWYHGIKGLQQQELFVNEYLKEKKAFLPRKSCGIESVNINDQIGLIVIDSQWFLEDWDNQPTINDNCDIKTREKFFEELESLINKNQNKTTLIAIHHPLLSNGPHGGQFSWDKQLYPSKLKIPVPVLGSYINLLRKTSGISPQDLQNKQYQAFVKRFMPMIQNKENVLVVSGHEHNLQYIEYEGIKQVVSGSASKKEAARAIYPTNFSYGGHGYVMVQVKENGSSVVRFFSSDNNQEQELFAHTAITTQNNKEQSYPKPENKTVTASIYSKEMTSKSGFYKFLWGKHYREYYSTPVEAPVVLLDTLYGRVKPTIAGGGHQSLSLRLKNKEGKEYVMRALKKSASRFLQTVAFKDQNVESEFKNTIAEQFIYDYYTTAHPYTPFIIGDLAESAGVFHSNPKLVYIPKQVALGNYNNGFGDELYMIEERPTDEQKDVASFGKPDAIIGTDDLLANIRKDEKYQVDEEAYIKARLFDMLIGDWDRHADQWRWAEYLQGDKVIYKPIPRDRDQAFAKIDGNLLSLIVNIPAARHMKSFKKDFPNVKWFNFAANSLDLAFIKNNDPEVWRTYAKKLVEDLSDEKIDKAFANLPKEISTDVITQELKTNLKARKKGLEEFAIKYCEILGKKALLLGTDKKDKFRITRLPQGKTKIEVLRLKKDKEELRFSKVYDKAQTKEIWIYGLDDEDIFEVNGKGTNNVLLRLIGGQNQDTYLVENGKKIKIHDFKSKGNSFTVDHRTTKLLSDEYERNEYYYKRPTFNATMLFPSAGFNPDDGVKLGAAINFVKYGFVNNPYAQKQSFKGNYFFATQGFELFYNGVFANAIGKWNFELDARYTTPNFSINYFGYGNETQNQDDVFGMDYNRVKIQIFKVTPSLHKMGKNGGDIQIKAGFENVEVESTHNRFVNMPYAVNPKVFEYQQFANLDLKYGFENYDNVSKPTMGMSFSVLASWKTNLSDMKRNFPYLEASYGVSHKINTNGKLVFGTLFKGKAVLNNNYEFYQGATLGGDYDLRGFRNQRFLGKQSFFQSSDLRWEVGKIRQSLVPMSYGLLTGYDYGRVWLDGETSNKWHQSVGGGVWLNGLNAVTARLTFFNSSDGNRIAFGLGFGF